jgi:hypothetical protein
MMATGEPPIETNARTSGEKLPPISSRYSEGFRKTIYKGMELRGVDRWQSIKELRDGLFKDGLEDKEKEIRIKEEERRKQSQKEQKEKDELERKQREEREIERLRLEREKQILNGKKNSKSFVKPLLISTVLVVVFGGGGTVGVHYYDKLQKEKVAQKQRIAEEQEAERQRIIDENTFTIDGLMYQNQPFSQPDKENFDNQVEGGRVWTWDGAINYCDNLSLAGYDDWRLPQVYELKKLLTLSKNNNTKGYSHYIRSEFVENMPEYDFFWSITEYNNDSSRAWYVNFGSGYDSWNYKSGELYALCVRGQ